MMLRVFVSSWRIDAAGTARDGPKPWTPGDNGMVLVITLLLILMMSALGAGFVLVTTSESMIAANFRVHQESQYAAHAIAERALADLALVADWNTALSGAVQSLFVDGLPSGTRTLADGSAVNLTQLVNLANCGKTTACSTAEMDAVTGDRPHGVNNPRWRAFAYGRIADLAGPASVDSLFYGVVLVGDDPSEIDGDPLRDGTGASLGAGVLVLRAQSFGPRGVRRQLDLTVARAMTRGIRVLSWRY